MHFFCGDRSHTGDFFDRQCGDKGVDLLGGHNGQSIWFLPIGGDLGDELVYRYTCRHRYLQLLTNALTYGSRDAGCGEVFIRDVAHVQIGLIKREGLDNFSEVSKYCAHDFRCLAVLTHLRRYNSQLRAQAHGLCSGHGRAHAEGTGFIIAGGEDAPALGAATHRHGNAQ